MSHPSNIPHYDSSRQPLWVSLVKLSYQSSQPWRGEKCTGQDTCGTDRKKAAKQLWKTGWGQCLGWFARWCIHSHPEAWSYEHDSKLSPCLQTLEFCGQSKHTGIAYPSFAELCGSCPPISPSSLERENRIQQHNEYGLSGTQTTSRHELSEISRKHSIWQTANFLTLFVSRKKIPIEPPFLQPTEICNEPSL